MYKTFTCDKVYAFKRDLRIWLHTWRILTNSYNNHIKTFCGCFCWIPPPFLVLSYRSPFILLSLLLLICFYCCSAFTAASLVALLLGILPYIRPFLTNHLSQMTNRCPEQTATTLYNCSWWNYKIGLQNLQLSERRIYHSSWPLKLRTVLYILHIFFTRRLFRLAYWISRTSGFLDGTLSLQQDPQLHCHSEFTNLLDWWNGRISPSGTIPRWGKKLVTVGRQRIVKLWDLIKSSTTAILCGVISLSTATSAQK